MIQFVFGEKRAHKKKNDPQMRAKILFPSWTILPVLPTLNSLTFLDSMLGRRSWSHCGPSELIVQILACGFQCEELGGTAWPRNSQDQTFEFF